jgi:hypothetical protein
MSGPEIAGIVLGAVSIVMLLLVVVLLNRVYVVIRRDTKAPAQVEEQPDTDAE